MRSIKLTSKSTAHETFFVTFDHLHKYSVCFLSLTVDFGIDINDLVTVDSAVKIDLFDSVFIIGYSSSVGESLRPIICYQRRHTVEVVCPHSK